MKIDFSQELLNFSGKPIKQGDENLTLGRVFVEALLANDSHEKLDGAEKIKRYELAKDIHFGKRDSLSVEEVVLIKELVGKYYTTLVAGQVIPMIDSA